MAIKDTVKELITPTIQTLGYDVWAVDYLQGGEKTIKVYIDHEDGITVDDCSLVSGHVSAILDVEEPINTQYRLEVSSPGLERELFTISHYEKYIGENAVVRLIRPINKRRKLTGKINKVENNSIFILVDNEELEVDFGLVNKGNLVVTW